MFDPTFSRYRHSRFQSEGMYRRFVQKEASLRSANNEQQFHDIPAHGPYAGFLFRPEWKQKREFILSRDKCCIICYSESALQVHHRQYHFVVRERKFRLPWEYPDHLLVTLCESCHKRGHNRFTVPTINV